MTQQQKFCANFARMDLKISKMTWVHERNKFKIFLFLFHEKMAQFEENSILREFLDVFQNGTPARLALFGVAQSEALLQSQKSNHMYVFTKTPTLMKLFQNNAASQQNFDHQRSSKNIYFSLELQYSKASLYATPKSAKLAGVPF